MSVGKTVNILVVEDDQVDVMAIQRAFAKARIANPMRFAVDGVDALDILRGTNGNAPLERPYIILLDLNMPRMGGIELLEHLRNDPVIHDSVVFVMPTSNEDSDRMAAYGLNVAGYIVKPRVAADFMDVVGMLHSYWRVVELP